jgi:hypothetical protein
MRVEHLIQEADLILRSIAKRCVSKDEATWASWFETRGGAALLTMRVGDLIPRSIAQRCVSKDEAVEVENAQMDRG